MAVTDVIKFDGNGAERYLVYKADQEDFNNLTQLIVHESQEAIFMSNGKALDLFGPGKYTLDTESTPISTGFFKRVFGKESPFHAEVYFINKTTQFGLRWGTSQRVRFIEPNTGIPLDIGAFGEMSLEVEDSRKLLVKLVGVSKGAAWSKDVNTLTKSIEDTFRGIVDMTIRSTLAKTIKEQNINIIEIDESLEELSALIHEKIKTVYEEYGLLVPHFYISHFDLPEEDKNFKRIKDIMSSSYLGIKEAEVEAEITAARRAVALEQEATTTATYKMQLEREKLQAELEAQKAHLAAEAEANRIRLEGLAKGEAMAAQGYNQKDVLTADVQKAYAEAMGDFGVKEINGGTGGSATGIASDMMQMTMGMSAAQAMSGQMKEAMNQFSNNAPSMNNNAGGKFCSNCGAKLNANAKFCSECGNKVE